MAAAESRIRLVVNADDFGASELASRGILEAHRDGIVTSTSVLGNCEDLAGTRALLREAPRLGVGLHVALVGGRPLLPPEQVPTLVEADGRFPSSLRELYARWFRGQLLEAEIERELDAQLVRLRDAGLVIDHVDAHRHLGFLPLVGRAMETIARRHRIPGIRSTVERPNLAWFADLTRGAPLALMSGLAWLTRRQLGALRHGPQSWGYVESGRLDVVRILEIIGRLGPGAHELICHPSVLASSVDPLRGERDEERARELDALRSPLVREALQRRGIELCRWADLF